MIKLYLQPVIDSVLLWNRKYSLYLRFAVWCRPMYSCCVIYYIMEKAAQW